MLMSNALHIQWNLKKNWNEMITSSVFLYYYYFFFDLKCEMRFAMISKCLLQLEIVRYSCYDLRFFFFRVEYLDYLSMFSQWFLQEKIGRKVTIFRQKQTFWNLIQHSWDLKRNMRWEKLKAFHIRVRISWNFHYSSGFNSSFFVYVIVVVIRFVCCRFSSSSSIPILPVIILALSASIERFSCYLFVCLENCLFPFSYLYECAVLCCMFSFYLEQIPAHSFIIHISK